MTVCSALLAGLVAGLMASAALAESCDEECARLPAGVEHDACLTKCRILKLPPGATPAPSPLIPPAKVVEPRPLDSKTPWRPPAALKPLD